MSPTITTEEAGKRVVDGNGNEIGVVIDVDDEDETVHVEPDREELGGELKTRLGWGTDTASEYPLRNDATGEITDNAIQLREEY